MIHPLIILVFMVVFLREMAGEPALLGRLGHGGAAVWSVAVLAAVWGLAHLLIRSAGRRLDRTGRVRHARRADRIASAARVAAVGAHGVNVLALGWLDAVRAVVGDVVVVDEVVAVVPVLGALVLIWWSMYPVDRRLREAVLLRDLDEGRAVHPLLSRGRYVVSAARHQMAVIVAPMVLILAWSEVVDHGAIWAFGGGAGRGAWESQVSADAAVLAVVVAQLGGVLAVFGFMPQMIRLIWDTAPLGPGELRDRLGAMCRAHGVRVRALLVWRTHGAIVNAAVMGLFAPLRYILLTDGLLEGLPARQVEAVAAHEVGHIRRRHMAWLGLVILTSVTGAATLIEVLVRRATGDAAMHGWAGVGVTGSALAAGMLAFGYVSRRFEWQADAFAAQHLSGMRRGGGGRPEGLAPIVISGPAVEAMSGALESVAELSCVPRERSSWRHGSIATRQRRLAALVGAPADRLAIDRQVGWLKLAAAAACVGLVALIVV